METVNLKIYSDIFVDYAKLRTRQVRLVSREFAINRLAKQNLTSTLKEWTVENVEITWWNVCEDSVKR